MTEDLEKRNIEQAQFALTVEQNQVEQDVAADIGSGKITSINDIEKLQTARQRDGKPLSDEYIKAAKQLILSTKKGDDVLEAEAYNELTNDFYLLGITKGKGRSKVEKASASILELTKFRIKMMNMLVSYYKQYQNPNLVYII